MNRSLFEAADHIYSISNSADQYEVRAAHPKFRDLSQKALALSKDIGDEVSDQFWADLLRPLKTFIFRHMASPAPFNHPDSRVLLSNFKARNSTAGDTAPIYAGLLNDIESTFQEIVESGENPIGDRLLELGSTLPFQELTGLVVCRMNLKPYVQELLPLLQDKNQERYVVLGPSELRGNDVYQGLVIFGHQRLFWDSGHVFNSARAKDLYVLGFDWVSPAPVLASGFERSQSGNTILPNYRGQALPPPEYSALAPQSQKPSDILQIEQIIPTFDHVSAAGRFRSASGGPGYGSQASYYEEVEAQVVELENGTGVFLSLANQAEETANRTYHVLDVVSGNTPQLLRLTVPDIESGMFLLLRTTGGAGDYIEYVADMILDDKAASLRDTQAMWKEKLRNYIAPHTLSEAAELLAWKGCEYASPQNLRNWISPQTIGLGSEPYFVALLESIGLKDACQDVLVATHAIRTAHRKAGHHISTALKSQVTTMSSKELSAHLSKDFSLGSADGGTLTAFKVKAVHEETFSIRANQTQQLFPLD